MARSAARTDLPPPKGGDSPAGQEGKTDLPSWLTTPVPATVRGSVILPSSAFPETTQKRRSAAAEQAQAQAMMRGTLMHRLLQSLPDIDAARR